MIEESPFKNLLPRALNYVLFGVGRPSETWQMEEQLSSSLLHHQLLPHEQHDAGCHSCEGCCSSSFLHNADCMHTYAASGDKLEQLPQLEHEYSVVSCRNDGNRFCNQDVIGEWKKKHAGISL